MADTNPPIQVSNSDYLHHTCRRSQPNTQMQTKVNCTSLTQWYFDPCPIEIPVKTLVSDAATCLYDCHKLAIHLKLVLSILIYIQSYPIVFKPLQIHPSVSICIDLYQFVSKSSQMYPIVVNDVQLSTTMSNCFRLYLNVTIISSQFVSMYLKLY